jgi:hypothetical protein
MSGRLIAIECVRCDETRLELLTDDEVRSITDGIGPVYRYCAQCDRMTGWAAGRGILNAILSDPSRPGFGWNMKRPVPAGQERLARQSEIDAIGKRMRYRKRLRRTKTK